MDVSGMDSSPQQYTLDFTSRRNELLALVSRLGHLPLVVGGRVLSRGRANGIVELLKRLILLAREVGEERIEVVAQKTCIAARLQTFRTVSESTVVNWRRDAVAIGVLNVIVTSHEFGRSQMTQWNEWLIDLRAVRRLIAQEGCNGLQWVATAASPGVATAASPGVATAASPHTGVFSPQKSIFPGTGPVCAGPARKEIEFLPEWPELLPIRDEIVDPISDEQLASLTTDQRAALADRRAFEPITEHWLRHEGDVRFWHRWQLRLADPVVGATQAHVALVLATARHAVAFPKSRLLRNRVALFVGIVAKRHWEPVRGRLAGVLSEMSVLA